MKKTMKKIFCALAVVAVLLPATARSQVSTVELEEEGTGVYLSLAGGLNINSPDVSVSGSAPSVTARSANDLGLAFLVEWKGTEAFALESGVLYINRASDFSVGTFDFSQNSHWVRFPLGAKLWLGDFLAFSAGPYVGFRVGDVTTSGAAGSGVVAVGLEDQARVDLGGNVAAQLNVPFSESFAVFGMARYARGLIDLVEGDQLDDQVDDISIFAGLRFRT